MRAVAIAFGLALLTFVPASAAGEDDPPRQPPVDPVGCLTQPVIPETFGYYVLWQCTAGQLGLPEPIERTTDCTIGFQLRLECAWSSPLDDADRVEDCVRSGDLRGSCILGIQPDPVACLVDYIRTQTPCR